MRTLESLQHTSLPITSPLETAPQTKEPEFAPPKQFKKDGVLFHLEGRIAPNERFNVNLETPLKPSYSYYVRTENFDSDRPTSNHFRIFRQQEIIEELARQAAESAIQSTDEINSIDDKAIPLTVDSPVLVLV